MFIKSWQILSGHIKLIESDQRYPMHLCSMLSASCSVHFALFCVLRALCPLCVECSVLCDLCFMFSVQCLVVSAQCSVRCASCPVVRVQGSVLIGLVSVPPAQC